MKAKKKNRPIFTVPIKTPENCREAFWFPPLPSKKEDNKK